MFDMFGSERSLPEACRIVVVDPGDSVLTGRIALEAQDSNITVVEVSESPRDHESLQGDFVATIVRIALDSEAMGSIEVLAAPQPPAVFLVGQQCGLGLAALRKGAWDAVRWPTEARLIKQVLQASVAEGRRRVADRRMLHEFHLRALTLSRAEHNVLEAICEGKLNKQIAAEQDVSIRTIEQRRRKVFSKMKVDSAVPLASWVAQIKTLQRLSPPHTALKANRQAGSDGQSLHALQGDHKSLR